jgi:hypothetical protein
MSIEKRRQKNENSPLGDKQEKYHSVNSLTGKATPGLIVSMDINSLLE